MEKIRNLEATLTSSMTNYLKNDGWCVSNLSRSSFGDIKAKKNNEIWLIDAKIIMNDSRIAMSSVYSAIGQLAATLDTNDYNYKYSIISNSENYLKKLVETFPKLITDSINLTFFAINDDGEVLPVK